MYYHNITCPDQNNGDGLRVVLWLSGCSHHCNGCQNLQTWNPISGIPFDTNAEEEVMRNLALDYISGITFSGGDPLYISNRPEVLRLCKYIREQYGYNKTIWLYTGYTYEEIIKDKSMLDILRECDVLVEGKYIEALQDVSLHWCGSSNQRVIDVPQSLAQDTIVLY